MSSIAWLTMIVLLGVVWGGFVTCLIIALHKEKRKT